MAELTLEQQRAIAIASARLRLGGDPAQGAATAERGEGDIVRMQRTPGHVEGIAERALQGLTFNQGDEIVGVARAALDPLVHGSSGKNFSERYDAAVGDERQKLADYKHFYPGRATAAEIAGAIPTSLGTVTALERVLGRGAGGAIGAGEGFAYGFGEGEGGPGARAMHAIPNTALGGAFGAAAPLVARGAANASQGLAAGRIADRLGVSRPASDILRFTTQADDSLSNEGIRRIASAGPNGMLADAGPASQRLLDTIVQSGGPGARVARERVQGRVTNASAQVPASLDRALGPAGAARPAKDANINPLYEQAYATPIDYARPEGQIIENLVNTRVPRAAIEKANALMRLEGEGSRQVLIDQAENGAVTLRQMPDVRQLDYITRGLADTAEDTRVVGRGMTNEGRLMSGLSREIRQNMRALVPAYGDALDTAAGYLRERSAREFGEEMLNPRFSSADIDDVVGAMGNAERQRLAQGVRQHIDDTLANVETTLADPNQDSREALTALRALSSRASRNKIEAVVGPGAANDMFRSLDQADKAFQLRASIRDNSATAARQIVDRQIRGATEDGVVNAAKRGEILSLDDSGLLARAIQMTTGATEAGRRTEGEGVRTEVADVLTRQGPDAMRLLRRLRLSADVPERYAANANRLAQRITLTAAGAAQPLIGRE